MDCGLGASVTVGGSAGARDSTQRSVQGGGLAIQRNVPAGAGWCGKSVAGVAGRASPVLSRPGGGPVTGVVRFSHRVGNGTALNRAGAGAVRGAWANAGHLVWARHQV